MNSQQIAYFLEVVRQGSFTKAAQVLYTSQPSLSRQIARLEDEFGAELFCRSRTGAVLSPIGKKYYALFVEMEKRLAELSMEAKRESLQLEKSVHIGVPEGWDVLPLIEKMEALLSARGEKLKMTFSAYSYRLLLSQLRNHQIDGCICPKGLIVPLEHMAFLDLPPLQNVLLYSRKHCPPENGQEYTVKDFRKEKLLLLEQEDTSIPKAYQLGFLQDKGIIPETKEYHNIDSILLDVSLDKGFAISDIWSRAHGQESVLLKLDQKCPSVWHGRRIIPLMRCDCLPICLKRAWSLCSNAGTFLACEADLNAVSNL